jgi:tetratricopeptide (TPR) repeat protein
VGHRPSALYILGQAHLAAGRFGETQKTIEELLELGQKAYVSAYNIGTLYMGIGDIDKAFDWLEKAVDQHATYVLMIPTLPGFDPLRTHPRYQALLRKMNLHP